MSPVLSVRNLTVTYETPRGPVAALRDVSLDIGRGEVVGLVGESGSGKSTLAAAVMRLLPPNARASAGEVVFAGEDLMRLDARQMRMRRGRGLAMVFQDPMTALNPVRSIETQLVDALGRHAIPRAEKRARAVAMLKRVGIPDPEVRIRGHAHQFSGGMRQRIAIAMALLTEPLLLIADEATTALDVTMQAEVLDILRRLKDEVGCAILFVSHDFGTVAEIADSVAVMYAGEVVEHAPVGSLYRGPAHPYARALLGCDLAGVEPTGGPLPTIAGGLPDLLAMPPGCVYAERCPDSAAICAERPPLRAVAPSHHVRCHLAGVAA